MPEESSSMSSAILPVNAHRPDDHRQRYEDDDAQPELRSSDDEEDEVEILNDEGQMGSNGVKIKELSD